jgi:hypothetical protein
MLSRTQVTNEALRMIAANLVADFDEDTESARQAKSAYDQVVRAELEAHAWFFAKTQASLVESGTPPAHKFARAFQLPGDFLRLVEIRDRWVFSVIRNVDTDPVPLYELNGRTILSDFGAPLPVTYIRDMTADPTQWSPLFADVVSAALALKLAMPLTKSEGMVEMCEKMHRRALARASKANAIQMPPQNIPDGSWMAARVY